MLRTTYFQNSDGPRQPYSPYLAVEADTHGGHSLHIKVRDHAVAHGTENGAHFDAGHISEVTLGSEQALDLAKAILDHYEVEINRTIQEHIEQIGEVSVTDRKIIIENAFGEPLRAQTARLAQFILAHFADEPSEDEGAIDVAIRLLGDFVDVTRNLRKSALASLPELVSDKRKSDTASAALIADGLRKGQAHAPAPGETQDTTLTPFVSAGTGAVYVDPLDNLPFDMNAPPNPLVYVREAALPDGSNEHAKHSAPLPAAGSFEN